VTGVTSSATPATPAGVLLLGLGTIGQTHARALESASESGLPTDVVAGVDVDRASTLRFRGADRPVYPSVRVASVAHRPAIVVIATPTSTHAAVCEQAARYFPQARLLVEKPAAATLGNSWLDSGINALSVLARFATIVGRESLRRIGTERQSIFEARLACHRDGPPAGALLVTSWHAADGAKTTRLRYASGIELRMDHTAVAAYLLRDGRIEAAFGADRSIPRRDRHYRALYQRWLAQGRPTLPPETSLHLHELLLGG
jgi:GFO/IDH/MocA oxidoreductase family protein